MGTWNTKPFDNDTARDWLWKLVEAKDEAVLRAALGEDADGDETIAAAAIISAARRQPIGQLPPKAKAWVSERGFVPGDALLEQAIAAVGKIKICSELRELWAESDSLTKWLKQMNALLSGLREGRSLPPPARKPRTTSAPRLLEKIAEKIKPEEESSLRERLRHKLEAIIDLEAPLGRTLFPESPLTLLAKHGLLPEARKLVKRGAKINPARRVNRLNLPLHSPLEAACKSGQTAMVKWLLEQGANISPGALYGSVKSGSIATIELLLKHGARLETAARANEDNQLEVSCDMLLHKAVDANYPHVMAFLVRSGLNLETRNTLGMTPLIWAAVQATNKDRKEMVEMLLSLGADPNAEDNDGHTALDAVLNSNQAIAELIKKYGGRSGRQISDSHEAKR